MTLDEARALISGVSQIEVWHRRRASRAIWTPATFLRVAWPPKDRGPPRNLRVSVDGMGEIYVPLEKCRRKKGGS